MRLSAPTSVVADAGDHEAIHRAVDALVGGGIVVLGPGDHRVSSTIRLRSDVALVGAGPQRTTVTLEPGSSCHIFTNDDHDGGNRRIELRGFALEGHLHDQPRPDGNDAVVFACGGYFKRVEGLRIEDVAAHGMRQTAFHFSHCEHVLIRGLVADELGWSGVSTSGTDDIILRDVVVTRSGLDVRHSGVHLDGGEGADIDVVVDDCTGNAVMLQSKFAPLHDVVVRATARRALRGVALHGSGQHPLDHVVVMGEYVDNREVGVLVSDASHVFILDATIVGNDQAGVVVQGPGAEHVAIARCRIAGSPELVVARDGNRVAYVADTTHVETKPSAGGIVDAGTASAGGRNSRQGQHRALAHRIRARVAREVRRASTGRSRAVSGDDSYEGTCNICGTHQVFVRRNVSLREGYRCSSCKASLRYRGQADAILRWFSPHAAPSINELVRDPSFGQLRIWEPGVLGPLRAHLSTVPGYVMSDHWPDGEPGDRSGDVRCEDLMALTFPDESFDLVVTSDIFEHVRKPYVGFGEVHRVLRPGGAHIFSIPVQEPMREVTAVRVDTSGPDDVHLLEPRYHLGPGHSRHLVYNDFGRDLLDRLSEIGFDTEVVRLEAPSAEASRLLTFCSVKR